MNYVCTIIENKNLLLVFSRKTRLQNNINYKHKIKIHKGFAAFSSKVKPGVNYLKNRLILNPQITKAPPKMCFLFLTIHSHKNSHNLHNSSSENQNTYFIRHYSTKKKNTMVMESTSKKHSPHRRNARIHLCCDLQLYSDTLPVRDQRSIYNPPQTSKIQHLEHLKCEHL